jgi:hypothetical protein
MSGFPALFAIKAVATFIYPHGNVHYCRRCEAQLNHKTHDWMNNKANAQ